MQCMIRCYKYMYHFGCFNSVKITASEDATFFNITRLEMKKKCLNCLAEIGLNHVFRNMKPNVLVRVIIIKHHNKMKYICKKEFTNILTYMGKRN